MGHDAADPVPRPAPDGADGGRRMVPASASGSAPPSDAILLEPAIKQLMDVLSRGVADN